MRWFLIAALPFALSGCLLPTPLSLATFGLDAVSYAVSGKTVTDHGISLAMGEDCALIGILEGEICDDQPGYATADASAVLEPLPTSQQIAQVGDAQVYESARRAAAALGEAWSESADDDSLLLADLAAISPAAGEPSPTAVVTVVSEPPLPRAKPDHEVAASFEMPAASAVEAAPAAASEDLSELAQISLRPLGNNGDLLLAAAPAVTPPVKPAAAPLASPVAVSQREIVVGPRFWSEVGAPPRVMVSIGNDEPPLTLAKRFTRPMEVGG